jgi:hypothetical protein
METDEGSGRLGVEGKKTRNDHNVIRERIEELR